ncbi:MAG: PorT family protein [Cyclobacteriaceae bacterium]|nr:PorT family protein [Cyclobacteriaceae bacterium]
MKNLDKRSEFEEQWRNVFEDAEMAPSEGIWDKIDSALSKEEAGYFKRRAFMFKMLAAASIAFALGIGLFSVNYFIDQDHSNVALTSEHTISSEQPDGLNADHSHADDVQQLESSPEASDADTPIKGSTLSNQQGETAHMPGPGANEQFADVSNEVLAASGQSESLEGMSAPASQEFGKQPILTSDLNNTDESATREVQSHAVLASIAPGGIIAENHLYTKDHIYLIPIMPKGASKLKKLDNDRSNEFLASVGVSTGLFDPHFEQGGGVMASNGYSALEDARVGTSNSQLSSFNTSNKEFAMVRSSSKENKPEVSVSYGANVGYRLGRRILLQTGVAYKRANTSTTTTGYIKEADGDTKIPIVASHQYQLSGLSSVGSISETELKNQYEFVSIPIKAGYVIIDRKMSLALMAGASGEFFLNNKIVDKSDYFETLSTSSGEGSPYKRVHFNGSVGTQVGYEFARNYHITIEPSFQFAMNSFTKNSFYLNSYPSSFMVAFGVAYNFR